MFSLKEKEVNTGRQRELDLVKGFLMIMIVFIHSFQTIGRCQQRPNQMYIRFCLRCSCRQVPACICLPWVLEVLSHAIPSPKDMVRNGIKLLILSGH